MTERKTRRADQRQRVAYLLAREASLDRHVRDGVRRLRELQHRLPQADQLQEVADTISDLESKVVAVTADVEQLLIRRQGLALERGELEAALEVEADRANSPGEDHASGAAGGAGEERLHVQYLGGSGPEVAAARSHDSPSSGARLRALANEACDSEQDLETKALQIRHNRRLVQQQMIRKLREAHTLHSSLSASVETRQAKTAEYDSDAYIPVDTVADVERQTARFNARASNADAICRRPPTRPKGFN